LSPLPFPVFSFFVIRMDLFFFERTFSPFPREFGFLLQRLNGPQSPLGPLPESRDPPTTFPTPPSPPPWIPPSRCQGQPPPCQPFSHFRDCVSPQRPPFFFFNTFGGVSLSSGSPVFPKERFRFPLFFPSLECVSTPPFSCSPAFSRLISTHPYNLTSSLFYILGRTRFFFPKRRYLFLPLWVCLFSRRPFPPYTIVLTWQL